MLWLPEMIERLSFRWVRKNTSSRLGWRKKGVPKRKEGSKPRPTSAAKCDGVSGRGRVSREYVKWNSFSMEVEIVTNRFAFTTWIRVGSPSVPVAEVPYVSTSKVWFSFFE